MFTLSEIPRLFTYDHWANTRIIHALQARTEWTDESPPARLLAHILTAEEIWLARVRGQAPLDQDFWPCLPKETWISRLDAVHAAWMESLQRPDVQMQALISYHNSKGDRFETPLEDILLHLFIHGQHHRAQIATHLRAAGVTPPATDFIYFTRQGRTGGASTG